MAPESEAPIPAAASQLAPGTRLGKYEVVRLLGAGGMGAVYEAVHSQIGKRVAIKVLGSALAAVPGARARFLREAQLTSRVRHPHAVDVTDMGTEGDQTYIVMELLTGEDLGARLLRTGPIDSRDLVDILLPVCSAVASAHEAGIVHRDLKPPNIFLSAGANGLTPKVLDFGISKLDDGATSRHHLTSTGAVIGTPYYLAPEQVVDNRASSPASDQFAIGVILYECLTGARPFLGESLYIIFQAIVAGNPVPLRRHRPDVDPGLEAIVLRAMDTTPARRFPSVDELARSLWPFATQRGRLLWQDAFGPGTGRGAGALPPTLVMVEPPADSSPRGLTPSRRPGADSSPRGLTPSGRPAAPGTVLLPPTPVPGSVTRSSVVSRPQRSLKPVVAVGAVVLLAVAGVVWVSQREGQSQATPPGSAATAAPLASPPASTMEELPAPPPRPAASPPRAEPPPPDSPPPTTSRAVIAAPPARGASQGGKRRSSSSASRSSSRTPPPPSSRTPPPSSEKPIPPSRSLNPNAAPVID